jgi:hypothetical protein
MRPAARNRIIASTLAITAIAAPSPAGAQPNRAQANPGTPNPTNRPVAITPDREGGPLSLAAARQESLAAGAVVRAQASNGFDYGDAALGAGIAGALALLMTAGNHTMRRRTHVRHP